MADNTIYIVVTMSKINNNGIVSYRQEDVLSRDAYTSREDAERARDVFNEAAKAFGDDERRALVMPLTVK